MTLKQRRTMMDRFLLMTVFPLLQHSPLRPLTRAASLWHKVV
ncbi:MAG TPA: hypothetical protein VF157_07785 [Chloroflexota bacterium]